MIRTSTSIFMLFFSILFTLSGYTQDVNKIAQESNDTFYEIIKAERKAAENRMQFKANQNTTNYDIKYTPYIKPELTATIISPLLLN